MQNTQVKFLKSYFTMGVKPEPNHITTLFGVKHANSIQFREVEYQQGLELIESPLSVLKFIKLPTQQTVIDVVCQNVPFEQLVHAYRVLANDNPFSLNSNKRPVVFVDEEYIEHLPENCIAFILDIDKEEWLIYSNHKDLYMNKVVPLLHTLYKLYMQHNVPNQILSACFGLTPVDIKEKECDLLMYNILNISSQDLGQNHIQNQIDHLNFKNLNHPFKSIVGYDFDENNPNKVTYHLSLLFESDYMGESITIDTKDAGKTFTPF